MGLYETDLVAIKEPGSNDYIEGGCIYSSHFIIDSDPINSYVLVLQAPLYTDTINILKIRVGKMENPDFHIVKPIELTDDIKSRYPKDIDVHNCIDERRRKVMCAIMSWFISGEYDKVLKISKYDEIFHVSDPENYERFKKRHGGDIRNAVFECIGYCIDRYKIAGIYLKIKDADMSQIKINHVSYEQHIQQKRDEIESCGYKHLEKKNTKKDSEHMKEICLHPFKHRILNEKGSVCTLCGKIVVSPEKINQMINESEEFATRLSIFHEVHEKLIEEAKLKPTGVLPVIKRD